MELAWSDRDEAIAAELASLARSGRYRRSIALAGFMGVVESSVGRLLAAVLDRPFYDHDAHASGTTGRGQAGARGAGAEDPRADPPIGPGSEGEGAEGVDDQEGTGEEADRGVAEVELLLDDRRDRRWDIAVHVVEEVDADHHCEGVAGVTLRHSAIIEVGLLGRFRPGLANLVSRLRPASPVAGACLGRH